MSNVIASVDVIFDSNPPLFCVYLIDLSNMITVDSLEIIIDKKENIKELLNKLILIRETYNPLFIIDNLQEKIINIAIHFKLKYFKIIMQIKFIDLSSWLVGHENGSNIDLDRQHILDKNMINYDYHCPTNHAYVNCFENAILFSSLFKQRQIENQKK